MMCQESAGQVHTLLVAPSYVKGLHQCTNNPSTQPRQGAGMHVACHACVHHHRISHTAPHHRYHSHMHARVQGVAPLSYQDLLFLEPSIRLLTYAANPDNCVLQVWCGVVVCSP